MRSQVLGAMWGSSKNCKIRMAWVGRELKDDPVLCHGQKEQWQMELLSCSPPQKVFLTPCSSLHTDVYFIATLSFLWKVTVITLVSCLPLYVLKYLRRRFSPPSYSKLTS